MENKNNIPNLLKNKSFLQWLRKGKDSPTDNWEKWQTDSSENQQIIDDAKMVEQGISFKKGNKAINSKASFKQLSAKLNVEKTSRVIQPSRNWLKIAAAIALLLVAGAAVSTYLNRPELIEYQTTFAENESVILPDGSSITLAANSRLSYYDDFVETANRTLTLDGEAYFEVATQPRGKTFVVRLKDVNIEVVGTAFNVNTHRSASIISLEEGKINLVKAGIPTQAIAVGETASFNPSSNKFDLLTGQTAYWSAWRSQKWIFDKTSVKEITQRITETLGLEIQVENEDILNTNTSGEISIDNPTVLFESLSFLLDVKINQVGNTLVIGHK